MSMNSEDMDNNKDFDYQKTEAFSKVVTSSPRVG